MKVDFTLGELWQIHGALTFQVHCCEDDKDDPLVKLFVKELDELRGKVGDLIRLGEVENDEHR